MNQLDAGCVRGYILTMNQSATGGDGAVNWDQRASVAAWRGHCTGNGGNDRISVDTGAGKCDARP
eukprot:4499903-Pyramimonas_sp.AAC.1